MSKSGTQEKRLVQEATNLECDLAKYLNLEKHVTNIKQIAEKHKSYSKKITFLTL